MGKKMAKIKENVKRLLSDSPGLLKGRYGKYCSY